MYPFLTPPPPVDLLPRPPAPAVPLPPHCLWRGQSQPSVPPAAPRVPGGCSRRDSPGRGCRRGVAGAPAGPALCPATNLEHPSLLGLGSPGERGAPQKDETRVLCHAWGTGGSFPPWVTQRFRAFSCARRARSCPLAGVRGEQWESVQVARGWGASAGRAAGTSARLNHWGF